MANSRVGQRAGNKKDTAIVENLCQKLLEIDVQDRHGCGYHGLVNQGSTCYLNSLLQVFFMTKTFREAVKSRPTSLDYQDQNTFHRCLKELFKRLEMETTTTHVVSMALGIENAQKCDAAEYFEKILNKMDPNLSQIFKGISRHITRCLKCSKTIMEEIPFWTLPLSMNNVKDAIDLFFRPTTVYGEDQIYCETCDAKTDATIECHLNHPPEVLTLLLKRFEFCYCTKSFVKTDAWVEVPQTLNIESCRYELYAVLNHSGSLTFGHYTATIKSFKDGLWYEFNDTNVSRIRTSLSNDRYRNAYMLMYRKEKAEVGPRKGDDQQCYEQLLREFSLKGEKSKLVIKVIEASSPAGLDVEIKDDISTSLKTKVTHSVTDSEINMGMDLSFCISAWSANKPLPRQAESTMTNTKARCSCQADATLKRHEEKKQERISKGKKMKLKRKEPYRASYRAHGKSKTQNTFMEKTSEGQMTEKSKVKLHTWRN